MRSSLLVWCGWLGAPAGLLELYSSLSAAFLLFKSSTTWLPDEDDLEDRDSSLDLAFDDEDEM